MKKLISTVVGGVLVAITASGQGTVYVSNLDEPTFSSHAVAANSWFAVYFQTGTNPTGYTLDSVQLLMAAASGTPSAFAASIYDVSAGYPGIALGNLIGPEPIQSGLYTYTPSDLLLLPSTGYFIVLTGEAAAAQGAYHWNRATTYNYVVDGNWQGDNGFFTSSDGLTWGSTRFTQFQFAIAATPVPEPSSFALLFCGGALVAACRWKLRGAR
jgi:hypothetical protein